MKTRLAPHLTPDDAALLYRAFLLDALELYLSLRPSIEPVLYLGNGDDIERMREIINEDGRIEGKLAIRAQQGEGLGERLERAYAAAFAEGASAACAIGTDHPTLPLEYITRAFAAMDEHDLAIGPADDGGYYLLAMRRLHPELLRDMPYSTSELYGAMLALVEELRLRILQLPAWYDVDDAASLLRLWDDRASLPKGSRTEAALERLADRVASIREMVPSNRSGA